MKLAVIFDLPRYGEAFRQCVALAPEPWADTEVRYSPLTSSLELLTWCDYAVFLIDREQVGHEAWHSVILKTRRRPAALLFLVDEKEQIAPARRPDVLQALNHALPQALGGAQTGLVSTGLALSALAALQTQSPLGDPRQDRSLDAYLWAEDRLTLPPPAELLAYSGFTRITEAVTTYAHQEELLGGEWSPDLRLCALVSTTPRPTEDPLTQALQETCPDWTFTHRIVNPANFLSDPIISHAEAILFLAGPDFRPVLEAAAPILRQPRRWLVLDGAERFPESGTTGRHVLRQAQQVARDLDLAPSRVLLTSGYLVQLARAYQAGEVPEQPVLADRFVVLVDDWNLPLPRDRYREQLRPWLSQWTDDPHGFAALVTLLGGSN